MNPDELQQAILEHHLAGRPDAAAMAAAQLSAHPDSQWTQVAQAAPNPALIPRVDDEPVMTAPTTARTDDAAPAATAPQTVARSDEEGVAADHHNFLGGGLMDYSEAALQPFASDVSFGLVPKLQNALAVAGYAPGSPTLDAIKNIPAALMGQGNGAGERYAQYYNAANDANEERYAQLKAEHPMMNALGNAAGFLEGGRALGDVLPAGLAPKAGSGAFAPANMLKAGVVGGGTGAEDSLVDSIGKDQTMPQRLINAGLSTAIGAGTGAVLGPLLSKGVEMAKERLPGIGDSMGAGWRKAAEALGITKNELPALQQHLDDQRAAGITPTLASAMNAKQTGQLSKLANKNPDLATMLNEGKTAAAEQTPTEMSAAIERQIPSPAAATADPTTGAQNPLLAGIPAGAQEPGTIKAAIKANTTAAMDQIRSRQVPLPNELLQSPEIADATRGYSGRQLRARIDAVTDPTNATSGHLNVGEVNQLRDNLNGLSMRPGDAHATARQDLMNETRASVPEFNDIMQHYGNADKYRLGFKLGNSGRTMGSSDHAPTMAAVGTTHGIAGHQAGILTNLRDQAAKGVDSALDVAKETARVGATQRALQAASPQGAADVQNTGANIAARANALRAGTPAVNVPDEQNALGSIVRGTGAAAVGMTHGAAHHYGRAVMEFLGRNTFSPEVQQSIGRGLMSPDRGIQQQTLQQLQRSGASTEDIRNLANRLAGMSAYGVTDTVNGQ